MPWLHRHARNAREVFQGQVTLVAVAANGGGDEGVRQHPAVAMNPFAQFQRRTGPIHLVGASTQG
jgi:hypothetical protein